MFKYSSGEFDVQFHGWGMFGHCSLSEQIRGATRWLLHFLLGFFIFKSSIPHTHPPNMFALYLPPLRLIRLILSTHSPTDSAYTSPPLPHPMLTLATPPFPSPIHLPYPSPTSLFPPPPPPQHRLMLCPRQHRPMHHNGYYN